MQTMELVVDGRAGIYAPQNFAELFADEIKSVATILIVPQSATPPHRQAMFDF